MKLEKQLQYKRIIFFN